MSTAQPIRSNDELNLFKEFYLNNRPNVRNYALICIGLNSALRISDVLQLRWEDVYDFKNEHFLKHIIIIEKKTNKETRIAINDNKEIREKTKKLKKSFLCLFLCYNQKNKK